MEKAIYKYATVWGALGGTALAFIFIKTLGKDKNLALTKTLLIGGGIGVGIGTIIDLINMKSNVVTEVSLNKLAKSIGADAELQLSNYLTVIKNAKLLPSDYQKGLNVLNGIFLAKKDNKWNEGADLQTKKMILMSYNVKPEDFKVFQSVVVNELAEIITDIFKRENIKE